MELDLGTLRNMVNIQAYHFATLESVYMKLSLGFLEKLITSGIKIKRNLAIAK